MKPRENTFAFVLQYYQVVLKDNGNGTLEVYTEDGFWGYINKKYAQKVCRETNHDYKALVTTTCW